VSDGNYFGPGRFRDSLLWLVKKMKDSMRQDDYASNNLGDGLNTPHNNTTGFNDKKTASNYPPADHDSGYGVVVEDHYGGKKLGMTRVRTTTPRRFYQRLT
jgi:hypothetical protein